MYHLRHLKENIESATAASVVAAAVADLQSVRSFVVTTQRDPRGPAGREPRTTLSPTSSHRRLRPFFGDVEQKERAVAPEGRVAQTAPRQQKSPPAAEECIHPSISVVDAFGQNEHHSQTQRSSSSSSSSPFLTHYFPA